MLLNVGLLRAAEQIAINVGNVIYLDIPTPLRS